jgi:hypothetical protein
LKDTFNAVLETHSLKSYGTNESIVDLASNIYIALERFLGKYPVRREEKEKGSREREDNETKPSFLFFQSLSDNDSLRWDDTIQEQTDSVLDIQFFSVNAYILSLESSLLIFLSFNVGPRLLMD